jgi:hypothetical protein
MGAVGRRERNLTGQEFCMLELHMQITHLPPSVERDKIERKKTAMDEKIDEIVYGLYGIIEQEKKIIQDSTFKVQ